VKLRVTVGGSLARPAARRRQAYALGARVSRRLADEVEHELQDVLQSERAADPDARRDALERAVRRVWGAPL
jgi:hypothetical protein